MTNQPGTFFATFLVAISVIFLQIMLAALAFFLKVGAITLTLLAVYGCLTLLGVVPAVDLPLVP